MNDGDAYSRSVILLRQDQSIAKETLKGESEEHWPLRKGT
jgi:hypothetical protein